SGSGLGCPDWPTCHGGAVPPPASSAIIEFSHRALALLVTLLVVGVAAMALIQLRHRRGTLVLVTGTLFLLGAQVALGAVVVERELQPYLVAVHLATALALLALTVVIATTVSRAGASSARIYLDQYAVLALGAGLLGYVLLLSGALVTASAPLACPGWPLCGGATGALVVPIHLLHRLLGVLMVVMILVLAIRAPEARPDDRGLMRLLRATGALLIGQVLIGAVVALERGAPVATGLHLAVAAAFWASLVAAVTAALVSREAGPAAPSWAPTKAHGRIRG
ncbi:MAG: COX15/CtaA family protein, partial [Chloroflexi bacterium]|nr:COX15/CtaA family protein [Chloroflexota bacterium]